MSFFQRIPLALTDGVVVPGFTDRGPVKGHFVMYLGHPGSLYEPPEDPHVAEVKITWGDGAVAPDFHEALDELLWDVAEAHWALERSRDEAEAEDHEDLPF